MIAGLFLAAAALSGQDAYGPATPAPPAPPVKTSANECASAPPPSKPNEIVVCAPRPEGYRIDPDVLAAKKMKREAMKGRPKPPPNYKDTSCSVVGPAGCLFAQPGIDIPGAISTMGEIANRLSNGQEIGSIFVTDPQLTDYQFYQVAKKEREEKEALAKAKAATAKASAVSKPTAAAPASTPATASPSAP
jgi:hypothetical protein